MNNKKILIYNDFFGFGGHEIMTANLANVLNTKYHNIYFFYFNSNLRNLIDPTIKGYSLKFSSKPPWAAIKIFNPINLITLFVEIKKIRPDLVIIGQGSIEISLRGAIISKLLKLYTISYIPYGYNFFDIGVAFGKFRDFINRVFYLLFDAFITISEEQRILISLQSFLQKKVEVLPNYIKIEFQIQKKKLLLKDKDVVYIGVVGNIRFKTKGQDKVVSFAKLLEKDNINYNIIIYGEGRDKNKLKKIVKKEKMGKKIRLVGWIPDKKDIYSAIDIVVVFSNFDAFPLVIFEAISYLKPVFIPSSLGISKELGMEDFIYSSQEDLEDKIRYFYKNRLKSIKKLYLLKKSLMKRFSHKKFKKKLFKIIEEI